jgi:polyhydroxybutyrate depolymerase
MKNKWFIKISLLTSFIIVFYAGILSCSKTTNNTPPPTQKIYRFDETIIIDGITRSYTVQLPTNYYETSALSLVLALHGGGGSASQFESTNKLTQKATTSGFIVVYPNGTGTIQTWNAGNCCGASVNNNINDVKFISMLIDKLVANYNINSKKVYATGHSNGGMLCYRLACELSNKIAAIAPNSCTMVMPTACNPTRTMPILHMHSKLDQNVPYLGGYGVGLSGIYNPPLDSVFNVWNTLNNCTLKNIVISSNSSYTFKKSSMCNNNVSIHYYLTNDGGHGWPGGLHGGPNSDTPSTAINANDLLWDFFQQYQLP